MKKTILLLFGFLSAGMFAQSQYTVEQTEKSNDPKVVANFIVNYPTHPKTTEATKKPLKKPLEYSTEAVKEIVHM